MPFKNQPNTLLRFIFAFFIFFIQLSLPAQAQNSSFIISNQILSDSDYDFLTQDVLLNKLKQTRYLFDTDLGFECSSDYEINTGKSQIFIHEPIEISNNSILNGSWSYKYLTNRCGKTNFYTTMVTIKSGKTMFIDLIPGTTILPQLMTDSLMQSAIEHLKRKFPDTSLCGQTPKIIETKLNKKPGVSKGKQGALGSYEEIWTFSGCQKQIDISICFNNDGQHTTFTFKPCFF